MTLPVFSVPFNNEGMSDEQNLDDLMMEKAAAPENVSTDAGSVKQRSLKELIELDRYLAQKQAARKSGLPLALKKLSPPGSI